jgi:N-acetylglucosamine kinase-like BadF-type ATPase
MRKKAIRVSKAAKPANSLADITAILVECAKYTDQITNKITPRALKEISRMFNNISTRTIQRYQKKFNEQKANGVTSPDMKHNYNGI